jgi:acyl carrier protein
MSAKTDIVDPVRAFIVENFLFGQPGDFDDSQSFLDAGIVDSTGVLQLVAFLEQHYDIQITNEELLPENLDSIAQISQFLHKKRSAPV